MDEGKPAYDVGAKDKEAKRTWAQKCAQKERPKPASDAGTKDKETNAALKVRARNKREPASDAGEKKKTTGIQCLGNRKSE